ncbi:MAG: GTP 3',8-cyclase MoaA [Flavobacteriales bacterium]|nr:GTP 3',8-cyclase MoaA [Flavobacteriales bacterium]
MNKQTCLTDRYGRVHNYLRISLTERCNLRCFYCMPEEGIPIREKSCFMTQEELLVIARTFVELGVNKIRLTGGEPLIRKDAHQIILQLAKLDVELAITTNGVLVDQFIKTFNAAGIRAVNVSLDSLVEVKQNKISRRNYFKRVFDNICLLVDEGFYVKINVVLIKGVNDDEIIDFIELSKDKNVHIRFIEFMPFDGNKWDWSKGVGYKEIMDVVQGHYSKSNIEKEQANTNDTAISYAIKSYKGTFGIISSVTQPFCSGCNRIRLTADGKIKNCLFSNSETDLLYALRNNTTSIYELIKNNLQSKKAERGGMKLFNTISDPSEITPNRSMISIGG